jgi:hypothetical protein
MLVLVYPTALRQTGSIDTTIRISNHIFIGCGEIERETKLLRMNTFANVWVLKHKLSLILVADIPFCVCTVRE